MTAGYDARLVLHDLTLAVPDGKVTVLIGPNACKSTLLRALARLLAPRAGSVLLDGKTIARPQARSHAGIVRRTSSAGLEVRSVGGSRGAPLGTQPSDVDVLPE